MVHQWCNTLRLSNITGHFTAGFDPVTLSYLAMKVFDCRHILVVVRVSEEELDNGGFADVGGSKHEETMDVLRFHRRVLVEQGGAPQRSDGRKQQLFLQQL